MIWCYAITNDMHHFHQSQLETFCCLTACNIMARTIGLLSRITLSAQIISTDLSPQFVRRFQPLSLFLRYLPLYPACPPPFFLKSLFPLFSFLFQCLLRYFRQFPLPSDNPLLPKLDQSTFLGLKKYQRVILPVQLSLSIKNRFLIF